MSAKIIFIIGANGVGKTTVMNEVQKLLPGSYFEVHDFDERGVPNNADKTWRISETNYWVSAGKENQKKGVSTLIFGFSKPEEIGSEAEIILLDVNEKTIQERIKNRYQTEESLVELTRTTGKTLEKFITDNIYVSSLLRKSCDVLGCKIVSTDAKAPESIAAEILSIVQYC